MKISRSNFLKLMGAAVASTALAACGSSSSTSTAAGSTATGSASAGNATAGSATGVLDTIMLAPDLVSTSVDPCLVKTDSIGLFYELYEMLFGLDSEGKLYPILADGSKGAYGGYDHTEGTGEYLVYMYDYITDSAGNNVKASDVVFSYQKTQEAGDVGGWDGVLLGVEAVDDYTVKFTLPDEMNLGDLENVLARCFIFTEAAYNASNSKFAQDACGTGPYVMTDFTSGVSVTLQARSDYWQKEELKPQISQQNVNTIVYKWISENTQKVLQLQTGELDIVENMASSDAEDFEDGGMYAADFTVYSLAANVCKYVYGNCNEKSICHDVNMRRAIYEAIDPEALVVYVGNGTAVKAVGSSYFPDYNTDWEKLDNYNTTCDQAKVDEYLQAAGYNGEKVVLLCGTNFQNDATVVMQMIQDAGINCELLALDGPTAQATRDSSPEQWDIYLSMTASGDYIVNLWSHTLDAATTGTGVPENYFSDPGYMDGLNAVRTVEGHTTQAVDDFWQYIVDNALMMGLYTFDQKLVYNGKLAQNFMNDKFYLVPGACTYNV
jgi:ABC-type transport system substrate-binding protein